MLKHAFMQAESHTKTTRASKGQRLTRSSSSRPIGRTLLQSLLSAAVAASNALAHLLVVLPVGLAQHRMREKEKDDSRGGKFFSLLFLSID